MSFQLLAATTSQRANADCVLLQTIVESLADGVLILTQEGKWVYGNYNAHRMCQQLNLGQPAESVPSAIWQFCQPLLDHRPQDDRPILVEAEIAPETGVHYRLRVCWFSAEEVKSPYLLVTLEDCYQSARSRAIAETHQYRLTNRQAEVWLLHRTGHTYRDIATKLFVTLNTVKRHMKDIYAKQRQEF